MTPVPVNLAVEGLLDEGVLRHLLAQVAKHVAAEYCYGKQGKDHLRRNIARFNIAAAYKPFIVLTDLDNEDCPLTLLHSWLPAGTHPNLILRIAVREAESWLMADRERFAEFLNVPLSVVPTLPDESADPKSLVVRLARRSRKRVIREDLVPAEGSTSKVGKNYIGQLMYFVTQRWRIERARLCSPSLDRAINAMTDFHPKGVGSAT